MYPEVVVLCVSYTILSGLYLASCKSAVCVVPNTSMFALSPPPQLRNESGELRAESCAVPQKE